MKFSCLKNNIEPILQTCGRIINPRPTLPVLTNVLLECKKGTVSITSTNLEMSVSFNIGAKIETEGSFTVPAKLLADFVSSIPSEKISFSLEDNSLQIEGGTYKAAINGIDADEFPDSPTLSGAEKVVLDAQELASTIPLVVFASAADEARPAITGILMELDDRTMTLAAADGYRLAEKKATLAESCGKNNIRLLIPAKSMVEVQKILSNGEQEAVAIEYDQNQAVFSFKEGQIISRLLAGQFPDYKQIMPTKYSSSIIVETEELSKAVRTALLFAKDTASVIHLEIVKDQNKLQIKAGASQVGENTIELAGEAKGSSQIAFNARYVTDMLSVCKDKQVALKINDALSPGELSPVSEDAKKNYRYIIMPIRT